ncbi:hypothetical protein G9A89_002214 [Geosiphon pyriformis]|nr:hypothetical protein G9A89_002214 [Geosiphon pyriformis]
MPSDVLTTQFVSAFEYISNITSTKLSNDVKLKLYAYYKSSTIGPCNTSKPSLFEFTARAKWEAWKETGEMSQEEAMTRYIDIVEQANIGWKKNRETSDDSEESETDEEQEKEEAKNATSNRNNFHGVSVSKLSYEEDSEDEKANIIDIFFHAKQGNLSRLLQLIDSGSVDINSRNREGLTALHWASDGGHLEAVKLLIEKGANVNALTSEKETPLHYACLAEQIEVARLLYRSGADHAIIDEEGLTAFEHCGEIFRDLVIKDNDGSDFKFN